MDTFRNQTQLVFSMRTSVRSDASQLRPPSTWLREGLGMVNSIILGTIDSLTAAEKGAVAQGVRIVQPLPTPRSVVVAAAPAHPLTVVADGIKGDSIVQPVQAF